MSRHEQHFSVFNSGLSMEGIPANHGGGGGICIFFLQLNLPRMTFLMLQGRGGGVLSEFITHIIHINDTMCYSFIEKEMHRNMK